MLVAILGLDRLFERVQAVSRGLVVDEVTREPVEGPDKGRGYVEHSR
jgi:hypothetical protein